MILPICSLAYSKLEAPIWHFRHFSVLVINDNVIFHVMIVLTAEMTIIVYTFDFISYNSQIII